MEEKDKIEIDFEELKKQMDKDIEKNGEYIKVEIIVSNNELCMPNIEVRHGDSLMMAKMIQALEAVKQTLIEEHPEVELFSYLLKTTKQATKKKFKEEEKNDM